MRKASKHHYGIFATIYQRDMETGEMYIKRDNVNKLYMYSRDYIKAYIHLTDNYVDSVVMEYRLACMIPGVNMIVNTDIISLDSKISHINVSGAWVYEKLDKTVFTITPPGLYHPVSGARLTKPPKFAKYFYALYLSDQAILKGKGMCGVCDKPIPRIRRIQI